MRRRYDTILFRHKIEKIKEVMPHAFIGVDVIVGTRGETDTCFEEARTFIESLDISQLHVFSYSGRPVRRHSRSTTSSTRKPSMPAASNCWTYPTVSSMLSTKRISARRRMSCLNKHAKEA